MESRIEQYNTIMMLEKRKNLVVSTVSFLNEVGMLTAEDTSMASEILRGVLTDVYNTWVASDDAEEAEEPQEEQNVN